MLIKQLKHLPLLKNHPSQSLFSKKKTSDVTPEVFFAERQYINRLN